MLAQHKIDWRRAEFVLTGFAFLGFITLVIRILKVPGSDLPFHPLIVHVPVILIPVSVLGALACLWRPRLLERYGILLCAISIIAMSSIFLSMEAGGALSHALGLQGEAAHLISEHSFAAKILAILFTLFTAALILTFAAHRISGGAPTGLEIADRILSSRAIYGLLRVGLLLLALLCAFYVYRVGDLGARAVWLGRLPASAQTHPAALRAAILPPR